MMTTRFAFTALFMLLAACGETAGPLTIAAVASPAGDGASLPTLSTDAAGRTVMSWMARDADSVPALHFALANDDGTWSAPATVVRDSALLLNWADVGAVVPTDDGRLVAYWMKRVPGPFAYDLYLASSGDAGVTWTEPVVPHSQARAGEHGFVSVTSRDGGGAEVQFLHGTFAPESAYAMALQHVALDGRGALAGNVPPPLDTRICDCCQTDVARGADGLVVVYRDRSEEEVRDIAIVRRTATGWSEPVRVFADEWMIAGCPVNGPAVAAEDNAVVVAWYTAARDTARVRVAFSTDGGVTFGAPTDLAVGPGALGRVDVTWLADGRALVSWLDRLQGGNAAVTVAAVTREGVVSWEGTAGTTTATRASGFPRLTRRGDDVLLAWTVPGVPTRIEVAAVRR